MKVAMDATPLTLSSGGILRYASELSKALAENFPDDEIVLVSDQVFPVPSPAPRNLRRGGGPANFWDRRWWLLGIQREMLRNRSEIFHGTHFMVPWLPVRPSVATIHDLSPWMDPAWQRETDYVRRRFPILTRLASFSMFITPSEVIRRQAIEQFRIHPGRIVTTPLAAGAHFRPLRQPDKAVPYFLYVGTLEPRKNLGIMLNAWREVRRYYQVNLFVVGRRRTDAPPLSPEAGLRLLGEVDDCELPALYSGALACLYPSLYEGFGLPVLEAMQCGAAVITSKDPAIAEMAGGVALQVDARDVKAWVEALTAAVIDPARVAQWRERSLERAKLFSWARTAQQTREVYAEAIRRFQQ
jgi:glycosyltransferase involved in cell wall biosynthesis